MADTHEIDGGFALTGVEFDSLLRVEDTDRRRRPFRRYNGIMSGIVSQLGGEDNITAIAAGPDAKTSTHTDSAAGTFPRTLL